LCLNQQVLCSDMPVAESIGFLPSEGQNRLALVR